MNRWAAFLAQTPPTLQRLVASSQRISLPRGCTSAARLARLRAALCRPAAVRAVYFALAPAEQQAVQQLRHLPCGLAVDGLAARLGPIRPLTELRADRAPRSLSERLLLLGWLLPRPATRNHPTRYLLPPELRAWLPVPLPTGDRALTTTDASERPAADGPCADAQRPRDTPALRAATAILVAAAAAPLPLRGDGRPTAAALRTLRPRLAPLPAADADALCAWLLPLLGDLGLLAPHGAAATPGPGAPRFLAAPPAERLRTLADAWVRCPRPDRWLTPLRVNTRGLDWPAFRRRLRAWAAALPPDAPADPLVSHALLHAALGPLADAGTHGFCASPRRSPWLPRRAAEVWVAACRKPLDWLGALPMADDGGPRTDDVPPLEAEDDRHLTDDRPEIAIVAPTHDADTPGAPGLRETVDAAPTAPAWRSTADGAIHAPRGVGEADLLTLAPFAAFARSDAAGDGYTLSRASVAAATAQGHDPARLRAVLLRRCGALPDDLDAALAPSGGLRMTTQTVLLSDEPADLAAALRRRSARRAVSVQLAPGVALVAPGREAALARALARDGRAVAPPPPASTPPAAELTPGEGAALLLAAAYYQANAPADGPPGPHALLRERLRAGLPPALRAATAAAIAALTTDNRPTTDDQPMTIAHDPPPLAGPPPLAELLDQLRSALRRRGAVMLRYQGSAEAAPRERIVRPLRLERHGPWWYLHAYCLLARAERCFRLDRVHGLAPGDAATFHPAQRPGPAPAAAQAPRRPAPRRPRSAPQAGFFAGPPAPPPGSPLVRVWLDEGSDQPVGGLSGDFAKAVDDDALHGVGVEWVAAHAIGARVDQRVQLPVEDGGVCWVEQALEDAALYP